MRRSTAADRSAYAAFETRVETVCGRLGEVYRALPGRDELGGAQRWLFDNDYLLWRSLTRVREDMQPAFHRRLRRTAAGTVRIDDAVRDLLALEGGRFAVPELRASLEAMQSEVPLDLAELWAVPTFARLALLEAAVAAPLSEQLVAGAVLGLHAVERQDWAAFVESVSVVEQLLATDPAGVYPHMDDESRDGYRRAVERLARTWGVTESAVCEAALAEAAAAAETALASPGWSTSAARAAHVGTYLVGGAVAALELRLRGGPSRAGRLRRAAASLAPAAYLTAICVVACMLATPLAARATDGAVAWLVATALALVAPLWLAAETLVNRLAAAMVAPRVLPKLDLRTHADGAERTLIVIPCMLTDAATIASLYDQLERHYVGSAALPIADRLTYALLADLPDAVTETTAEDTDLLAAARDGLAALRRRQPHGTFLLLARERRWNAADGVWMGWERKRGKLMELDALLLRGEQGSFGAGSLRAADRADLVARDADDVAAADPVRFVITLDADSVMPPGVAADLIGTLAHPLNRAVFDDAGRVRAGYTVLQPRIEAAPWGGASTRFSRLIAGSRGLDLYTLAVSDASMDQFGEGIYAGKGIYDVAAFDRSLRGVVPENAVLSHDLFEGGHGRAGLVSDVVLFETVPSSFLAYLQRQRRWWRGDWQLLPLLGSGLTFASRLAAYQNLLRSLVPVGVLTALCLACLVATPAAGVLAATTVCLSAVPYLVGALDAAGSLGPGGEPAGRDRRGWAGVALELERWLVELTLVPVTATAALGSIAVTLHRLFVTHRDLLRWRGAARESADAARHSSFLDWWRDLAAAPVTACVLGGLVAAFRPAVLPGAAPLLVAWLAAPVVARALSRPRARTATPLTSGQRRELRALARRTWLYFERFVGPEDHWLPPDHFQESPRGTVAHRTSPTNIGLLLTSTCGAYDLGFFGVRSLLGRLGATMATVAGLERYRGHLLNWYDTTTLHPLTPRYVSTVDSGNFLACLLAVKGACIDLAEHPVLRRRALAGLETLLDLYRQAALRLPADVGALDAQLDAVTRAVEDAFAGFDGGHGGDQLLVGAEEGWLARLDELLLAAVRAAGTDSDHEQLTEVAVWSGRLHRHVQECVRDRESFMPWLAPEHRAVAAEVAPDLPAAPPLRELPRHCDTLLARLGGSSDPEVAALRRAVTAARELAEATLRSAADIADAVERELDHTDLGFLYDSQRHVFRIGFDVEHALLDEHAYDLFASEARLASFIAVAYGRVPAAHWLHLGRPYTRAGGERVMLSWSGTMFEYLTPTLLLPTPDASVSAEAVHAAIDRQVAFGATHGVPWGVSESGYAVTDAQENYQYYAFGVPDLALARVATDELVIAPYATLMALRFDTGRALGNLRRLQALGALGAYGYYEALDFSADRAGRPGVPVVVRSYMAHHHGMSFMSIVNLLDDDVFVRRVADVRARATAYLLYEGAPAAVTLERLGDRHHEAAAGASEPLPDVAWEVRPRAGVPQVNALSNGSVTVLTTDAGAGHTRYDGVDVTRWRSDPTTDGWGEWLYLQEELRPAAARDGTGAGRAADGGAAAPRFGRTGSVTRLPARTPASEERVVFRPHATELTSTTDGLVTRLAVTVAPDDDVVVRSLSISNRRRERVRLALTSYGEVVLAEHAADARHPAFSGMFVESEALPDYGGMLFRRRPRAADEPQRFLLHALVGTGGPVTDLEFDGDRGSVIGRGGSLAEPLGLRRPTLAGTVGATLDPVYALRTRLDIEPDTTVRLAALSVMGHSRSEVLATAERYLAWHRIERTFAEAAAAQAALVRRHGLDPADLPAIQGLLSQLLYPTRAARAGGDVLRANTGGQHGLWAFGISGDHPILLVEVGDADDLDTVRLALAGHRRWRQQGVRIDLVVLSHGDGGYRQNTHDALRVLVNASGGDRFLDRPGGIFLLSDTRLAPEDVALVRALAMVVLGADSRAGVVPPDDTYTSLPAFEAALPGLLDGYSEAGVARPTDLEYDNGYGGFAADGAEYVVYHDADAPRPTPAPWVNVLANPTVGSLVSESGASTTWAVNSSENRLTPWTNDAVLDEGGEALYLRDEETAAVWTPTPRPRPAASSYLTRHTAGRTSFEHRSNGLDQLTTVFVPPVAPVKVVRCELHNRSDRQRRLTATYSAHWLLGTDAESTRPYLIPSFDGEHQALLARNPFNQGFGSQVVFLTSDRDVHGLTCDRTEFLGRDGSMRDPAALRRVGLSGSVEPGGDTCAVVQVHVDLAPGASTALHFVIGRAPDDAAAADLLAEWRSPDRLEAALHETTTFWQELSGGVQVSTPDRAMDILLNHWLPYQTLACRLWGRTAFYQSSGAYGFRDQLQDCLALVHVRPDLLRAQLLECARHQFEEGDVLHWWHPPGGQGVRTRFSDDLAWLPFATAHYLATTGDTAVLDEVVPYLSGAPLEDGVDERYDTFAPSERTGTLFEHASLALERASTTGAHGLPLMGGGDWNDGMNRVGAGGKGESVWLAWFLSAVLDAWADVRAGRGDTQGSTDLLARSAAYRRALEDHAWDGAWYLRAYYDDGTPLGSRAGPEPRIDALPQAWSVLSGGDGSGRTGVAERPETATGPETAARPETAMRSVLERLVDEEHRLVLLLSPPFTAAGHDPGYIRAYPPGVRENGGQYTHAAVWTAWALAALGRGEEATKLFDLLTPMSHAACPDSALLYRVEPYVVAADVYGVPPHTGRGGWTWYTGSAAWLYRLGLERLLGVTRRGDTLRIDPRLPASWPGYAVSYRVGGSTYHVEVELDAAVATPGAVRRDGVLPRQGEREAPDGVHVIALVDDGREHRLSVTARPITAPV